MELLSVEDFKDTKFDPNRSLWSLARGSKKWPRESEEKNFKIRNEEEKKRHYLYLKYFLYNAPLPKAMCKEENMGFK